MPIPVSRPRSALAAALAAAILAAATFAASPAPAAPADSTYTPPLPVVIETRPLAPCNGDSVALVAISPCWPCVNILSFGQTNDGHLRLEFNQVSAYACSTDTCVLQKVVYPLGQLAAGHHMVNVEVVWHYPPDSLGPGGTRTLQKQVTFDVGQCPTPLPFVEQVVVAGIPPCAGCPPEACPNQPVIVGLQGALPNNCWSLLGFEMLPLASPLDRPVARLTVREPNPLVLVDCPNIPVPFSVGTSFPAPAPGPHEVEIQVAVRGWADSTSLQIFSKVYPYVVKDSCVTPPPPEVCVWPYLESFAPVPVDTTPPLGTRCDLRLLPGGRGPVFLATRSHGTRLAGLQGDLGVSEHLKIVGVEAAGAAYGMRLQWVPKENGASFVLFSGQGAPIPADVPAPVLRVTVQADSGSYGPTTAYLHGVVRAASDSNGTSVPICPVMTLVLPTARICIGSPASCDANGDGVSNVADLVRMVRCIVQPGWCPDSVAARPDCNDDGEFHLDDVFCCARAILGVPRDSTGIGPGHLRFSFGAPVMQGSLLRVPLRVQGAENLSGALLRLEYPSDRWIAVDDATVGGDQLRVSAAADWTPLVEPGADDVLVGLLRFDPSAPSELTVTLAFSLRPGAEPGGELRVGASDLSAADGTPIDLDLSSLTAALDPGTGGPGARVGLSPARPNPTSGATSFTVSLAAAGNVDLAMFDLAGRRVATLWRGALPAGDREFTWRPAGARSGVYFARLVVNGEVRSTRVTLKLAR